MNEWSWLRARRKNFRLEEFPNYSEVIKVRENCNYFKLNNSKFSNNNYGTSSVNIGKIWIYQVKVRKRRTSPVIILEKFDLFYLKPLKILWILLTCVFSFRRVSCILTNSRTVPKLRMWSKFGGFLTEIDVVWQNWHEQIIPYSLWKFISQKFFRSLITNPKRKKSRDLDETQY